jgi:cell division septation protein DedD
MITKLMLLLALLSGLDAAVETAGDELAAAPALAAEPVATVQIELLPDHDGAEQLAAAVRERLAMAGLPHSVLVEIVPGEPELPVSYRVVVGPFVEFETAERARTELEGIGVHGFVREFEPLIGC